MKTLSRLSRWFIVGVLPVCLAGSSQSASGGYVEAVKGDSPLAYWRFDDAGSGNGSTADDDMNSHDGTYQGGTGLTVAGSGAPIGVANNKAAVFNGIGSYVDVGMLAVATDLGFGGSGDTGVTVEMWVKSDSISEGKVFGLSNGFNDAFWINLDEHPDGTVTDDRIRVLAESGDGTTSSRTIGGVAADTNITDNTWNYLAVTFKGDDNPNELKVYTADAGDTTTTAMNITYTSTHGYSSGTANDFLISAFIGGANNNGTLSAPYSGLIDEVAVYTTALSKSQLDAHVLASLPIVEYTGGTEASPTLGATYVNPNASATAINGDNVITRDDVNANLPASDPVIDLAGLDQTSVADAIGDNDFFEFSITPDPGYRLYLDRLVHDHAKGGPSGDRYFFIQTNTGSGGAFETIFGPETSSYIKPNFYRKTIDLSGAKFQDIMDTLTFRYYGYCGSDARTWEFDNIMVYGTVVVPEPSTLVLSVVGGLMLLVCAWRRRKK